MKLQIKKASTDVSVYIFVLNSSVSTGAGLTGLVYNTASLVCYYVRPLGSATAISLVTQTVTGAHSDGGFVEVSSANMPGIYRLDLPDAVCATGVNSVVVMLKGATNMAPVCLELELVAYDPQDTVHLGLTSLPNTAVTTNGSLITMGTGTAQLNVSGGRGDANTTYWGGQAIATVDTNGYPVVTIKRGTGAGCLQITSGIIQADVEQWLGVTAETPATIANIWDYSTGTGRTLSSAVNITSNDGKIAMDSVDLGSGTYAVKVDPDSIIASVTGAVGSVTGAVGSVTGAVGSVTGSVGSVAGTVASIATDGITANAVSTAAVTKIAGGILSTPANKIYTDSSGRVNPRLERISKASALNGFEFLLVDSTDHSTPKTGRTVTAQRSKNGGAFSDCTNSPYEVGSGIYAIDLTSLDTDADVITLKFTATASDARYVTIVTQTDT